MNNQIILWSSFFIPWLTLFFMPTKDIKRFLPAAFLVTVLCVIFTETGVTNGWWTIRETTYPLAIIPTYTYGAFPVMTMWILKYTFGRFWLFAGIDLILNAILAFVIYPWIAGLGIKDFHAGLYIIYLFASAMALIVYTYLAWHEGLMAAAVSRLQPAAAKPAAKEPDTDHGDNCR